MSAAMRTATTPSADAMWTAFLARDRRWDGRFVAGVRTTGIFCRPTCTCRKPLRRNVRFFASPAAAARAGFRPCKRCRPELAGGASEADRRLAARALTLMRCAPGERWPVRRLARALARLRLERAQALLARGERVLDVALEVGFGSGSAFARAWRRQHGVAPARSVPRPIRRRQA